MSDLQAILPTFHIQSEEDEPYGGPPVDALISVADNIRIVLGSHDLSDYSVPDIMIERRPNGWMIFLHPEPGGDPSGAVVFLDKGRSYVCQETGSTPPVEMVSYEEAVKDLDKVGVS